MRHTDVDRCARETAEALRRHADAVVTGDDRVDDAASALARALEDYGAALVNHGSAPIDALTELAEDLTGVDEDELDEDTLPAGTRLSVRLREDVIVADPQRLIQAGRRAYRERWPDERNDAVAGRISDVVDALNELVHDPWLLRERGDEDGLVHAGSIWTVCEVEAAWQEQDDEVMLARIEDDGAFRDDPFALPVADHED
jgi:hypothetical protein